MSAGERRSPGGGGCSDQNDGEAMPRCALTLRLLCRLFSQQLPAFLPPRIYFCYHKREEGPCEGWHHSPAALAHPRHHSHTHASTLAGPTYPGTQRCRAKNGALLRLTQCGVAEISCRKKQDWEDTRVREEGSAPSLPAEEAVGSGGGIREGCSLH